MNGQLIRSKDGDVVTNPLVPIARRYVADMVRYGSGFGLTALSRSRLAAGISAPQLPGKFDGLLG